MNPVVGFTTLVGTGTKPLLSDDPVKLYLNVDQLSLVREIVLSANWLEPTVPDKSENCVGTVMLAVALLDALAVKV